MNNYPKFAIMFKLSDITPWTVIYRTDIEDDLMYVYKTLNDGKPSTYNYRLAVYLAGSYRPIIF